MKTIKTTGEIASQPLVITDLQKRQALVILMVKTNVGYIELYYEYWISSLSNLKGTFVNSVFSKIALSAIGDKIEVEFIEHSRCISSFKNKTQGAIFI